jgi:hypothetical protein
MVMDTDQGMLSWTHSGFHVHDALWAAADEKEFTVRLARYCVRNPIALGRMEYEEQLDTPITPMHSREGAMEFRIPGSLEYGPCLTLARDT